MCFSVLGSLGALWGSLRGFGGPVGGSRERLAAAFKGPWGSLGSLLGLLGEGQRLCYIAQGMRMFMDSRSLQVPIGSPNGLIWSTFGAETRGN